MIVTVKRDVERIEGLSGDAEVQQEIDYFLPSIAKIEWLKKDGVIVGGTITYLSGKNEHLLADVAHDLFPAIRAWKNTIEHQER